MPREPVRPTSELAAERPSKTRLKHEMQALQSLGEALAALPETRLAEIELPEPLRDAIGEFRRTRSHEGRRRQMQYIGKLMRSIDAEPAREAIAREHLGSARATLALHRVEHWRERLVGDDDALAALGAERPATDIVALRRLLRAARAQAGAPGVRQGRAYRELFRFLKEALGDE